MMSISLIKGRECIQSKLSCVDFGHFHLCKKFNYTAQPIIDGYFPCILFNLNEKSYELIIKTYNILLEPNP